MGSGECSSHVPRSVGTAVRELFVPECRLPEAKQEAEGLKCVEISKLDLQWVQVSALVTFPAQLDCRTLVVLQAVQLKCLT